MRILKILVVLLFITTTYRGYSQITGNGLKELAMKIAGLYPQDTQNRQTFAVGSYSALGENGVAQAYYVVTNSNTTFPVPPGSATTTQRRELLYQNIRDLIAVCAGTTSSNVNVTILGNLTRQGFPPNLDATVQSVVDNIGQGNGFYPLFNRPTGVHAEAAIEYYFGFNSNNSPLSGQSPANLSIAASRAPCRNCAGFMSALGTSFQCPQDPTRSWTIPIPTANANSLLISSFLAFLQQIQPPEGNSLFVRFPNNQKQAATKGSLPCDESDGIPCNSLYNTFATDFSFTSFEDINTQQNMDDIGRFEGEFEVKISRRNASHEQVLIRVLLQHFDGNRWRTTKSYDNLYNDMFGDAGRTRRIDYSFNIIENTPNGQYRVQARIYNDSEFHHDRDRRNNRITSSTRIVSNNTKRFKSHRDNGLRLANKDIGPLPFLPVVNNEFVVYPNPANSTLFINAGNSNVTKMDLIDANGKILKQIDYKNTQQINTEGLAEGMYFIRSGNGIKTQRILIQH